MGRIFTLLGTLGLLAACTSEPSHIPNPLLLPVYAVSTGVENSIYDARRNRVEAFVATHHQTILDQAEVGSGPILAEALALADVSPARQGEATRALATGPPLYRSDPEAVVVALMVHGG